MKRVTRVTLVSAVFAAVAGLGLEGAEGVPSLKLSDGSTTVEISDGGQGDMNSLAGAITFIGSIGGFLLNVTTGLSVPVSGSADAPHLDLHSVNVANVGGGGVLTITFSDSFTSPLAPYVAGFISAIGGTVTTGGGQAYVELETYLATSPDNSQSLGEGYYGPFSGVVSPFGGTYVSSILPGTLPYSLTEIITVSLPGGASASFNADLQALPEPMSLLLVGTGLIGLGFLSRRRLQRARG